MKKFLLSLFVGFVGIISFCNASVLLSESGTCGSSTVNNYCIRNYNVSLGCNGNAYVVNLTTGSSIQYDLRLYNPSNSFAKSIPDITSSLYTIEIPCDLNHFSIIPRGTPDFDYNFKIVDYDTLLNLGNGGSCPECPTCPEINTGEILSGYILESEIDTNYCVGNGLCPNECGSGTDLSGDLQYSNLYINSILHPGEENIFIDIPDYIQWDYSVTTGEFNIYVGSGYDMDYMNSIIKINSYRPDSSDFTDVFVSGLTLIFPYIFVVLLLMFIWKLLKRIFK